MWFFHYHAECHHVEHRYAECHYVTCRDAECFGALKKGQKETQNDPTSRIGDIEKFEKKNVEI